MIWLKKIRKLQAKQLTEDLNKQTLDHTLLYYFVLYKNIWFLEFIF